MKISFNDQSFGHDFCMLMLQEFSQRFPGINEVDAKNKVAESILRHCILLDASRKNKISVQDSLVMSELPNFKSSLHIEDPFIKVSLASGSHSDDRLKAALRDKLAIALFVSRNFSRVPPPADEMILEMFEKHLKGRMRPHEANASHIVIKPNRSNSSKVFSDICEIRRKILDGLDFAEAAGKYSQCKEPGGNVGWFKMGSMVEEFEAVVFSMLPGEISPVFLTPFGYHIAKLHEIRPPEPCTVENSKDEIVAAIRGELVEKEIQKFVSKQRPASKISVAD